MKVGDLVRFCLSKLPRQKDTDCGVWEWKMGLLVEYNTWEKVATVLYKGKLIRVRAGEVEKAGRKDSEVINESR
tara:strand:+ start:101 stop:322 length:222 start_codon:yes stop_codon:yes gene_type:complete